MKRIWQILLVVTFLLFSWLMMQVVHELGHVTVAWLTGAKVHRVVLHPLEISRTDIGENPHPLAVVWGGPLIGAFLPFLIFVLACRFYWGMRYLCRFFAGFCLVANGAYIGTGHWMAEESDCRVMLRGGSPVWVLLAFGVLSVSAGFYLWHRQGEPFGLGSTAGRVNPRAAQVSSLLLAGIVATEWLCYKWFC